MSSAGNKEEVGFTPIVGTLYRAIVSLCLLPAFDDLVKEVTGGSGGGKSH